MRYLSRAQTGEGVAFANPDEGVAFAGGRVAEWFKAAVLKTAVGLNPP
jgi:hypothetical protein